MPSRMCMVQNREIFHVLYLSVESL